MTQGQKRIKIAEACGWVIADPPDYEDGALMGHHKIDGTEFLAWDMVPDYFKDLNDCRVMRSHLTERQKGDYEVVLREVICGKKGFWYVPETGAIFQMVDATAEQHAETFGQTLDLWREGE